MARSILGGVLFAAATACGAAPGGPAAEPVESPAPSATRAPETRTPAAPAQAEALPAGSYRILLTRSDRVGARARVRRVTTDVRSTRTLRGGRQIDRKTAERRVELEAVSEVRAVDADGRATEIRYVVDRLEAATPKGPKPIVPPGTELVVLRKVGTSGEIRIGSQPLDDASLEALKSVVPTTLAKNTEQHVFGSDVPRRIGDSWEVDADRARAGISEVGIRPLGPARGTTRVVEKRVEGGQECLFVLGQLELERFELPGMPAGARTRRAKLRMRFSGAYPLDTTSPVRLQHISISMEVHAVARQGQKEIEIVVDSQRESQSQIDPL